MTGNFTLRPEDVNSLYNGDDGEIERLYREALAKKMKEKDPKTGKYLRPWNFETVKGFFKQADDDTDPSKFDYIEENFGLQHDSWKELIDEINELNRKSDSNVMYKVLFLARHGQGYHNYAILKYGQERWDAELSKQTGDGEIVWGPDPFLTELGVNQAKDNCQAWKRQLANGAPLPSVFYSSPFTRSIQTLINTWNGITNYKALIKEDVRETIGEHLCDKRSPKRIIAERFADKGFEFEEGFQEEDVYYTDDYRETFWEQGLRSNNFLNFLFEKDWNSDYKDTFVNVTSHSGTIRCFILALAHRNFPIGTGGMIPIVVKGTRRTDDLS